MTAIKTTGSLRTKLNKCRLMPPSIRATSMSSSFMKINIHYKVPIKIVMAEPSMKKNREIKNQTTVFKDSFSAGANGRSLSF